MSTKADDKPTCGDCRQYKYGGCCAPLPQWLCGLDLDRDESVFLPSKPVGDCPCFERKDADAGTK